MTISGPDKISTGETRYYTLSGGASNVIWSVDNYNVAITGDNTGATLTVGGNACQCNNGTITITAKDTATSCTSKIKVQTGQWIVTQECRGATGGEGIMDFYGTGGSRIEGLQKYDWGNAAWVCSSLPDVMHGPVTCYESMPYSTNFPPASGQCSIGNWGLGVWLNGIDWWQVADWKCSAQSQACEACSLAINEFSSSAGHIDPYANETICLSGKISSNKLVVWDIKIIDSEFNLVKTIQGSSDYVSATWDGKDENGVIVKPGDYTATLTAKSDGDQCTSESSIPVSVVMADKGSCTDTPLESSADLTNGNLSHDQELFSTKGTGLKTLITLYYNTLKPDNGGLGNGWSHSYDITIKDKSDFAILKNGSGKTKLYTRSGSGYVSPLGDYSTFAKNADGTYILTHRDGTTYNFNQSGKITSIKDRYNNALTLTYTNGDLTNISDSSGSATTLNYDTTTTPHRISSITDPNLKTYDFQYQGNSLWKVINPPDASGTRGYWEYTYYTTNGLMQTKKDPNGNLVQYTYDNQNRIKTSIDPEGATNLEGHTRVLDYPTNIDNIRTTAFTEKDGGLWTSTYDITTSRLLSRTDPNGNIVSYTYYSDGTRKSVTEPSDGLTSLTTFYTYDSNGNVLTKTDPADLSIYSPPINPEDVADPSELATRNPPITTAISYTYASYNRIASMTDHRGASYTTNYSYTSTAECPELATITDTDPIGSITKICYNVDGTVNKVTDANSKEMTFEYYTTTGKKGLLMKTTDINGVVTEVTSYDGNGNPLTVTAKDRDGNLVSTTTSTYDALGRLKTVTRTTATLPANMTQYGYDLTGNLTSVIDAENKETKYEYNYKGQVKKVTDALLKDTVFTYGGTGCSSCGGADKLTGVQDANLHETTYQYDLNGRLENETDPLGKKIRYTYYNSGRLKEKIDATDPLQEIILIQYTYDNLGRLLEKRYFDTTTESYTYYPQGQLQTATNSSISYTFTYYKNGWLRTVTDSNGNAFDYSLYDGMGQKKTVGLTSPTEGTWTVNYDYDTANRPWHITSSAGQFEILYDARSRRQTVTYPNQTIASYGYDDLDRLSSLSHRVINGGPLVDFTYSQYDNVGNLKSVNDNGNALNYTYDNVYRLLNTTGSRTEAFTYDNVGNRMTGPGPKDTGYAYNAANQMTAGLKMQYQYDNSGNQTSRSQANVFDKTWTQTWDYENRLVKVEKVKGTESKTVTFKYDPFGRRIEKKVESVKGAATKTETYTYVYDGESILMEILTKVENDGVPVKEVTRYVHSQRIDEPLAMERGGQYYYYHSNRLGSIAAITNSAKTIVQSYTYDSYGMPEPSTSFRNSYTYTGREWDGETGLYYYRARYYDPMAGRFVSKDPIGFNGGDVNLYGYVGGNPVNRIDPLGLQGITTLPYDPGYGPTPGNCAHYPPGLRHLCQVFPDDPNSNCARKCLKTFWPDNRNPLHYLFWLIPQHPMCWIECEMDPEDFCPSR